MIRHKESEKTLEANLYSMVKQIGGHALKFTSFSEIGFPDRIVLMPKGKIYWVELKSEREKPRLIQRLRHEELQRLGFQVFVIDSTKKLNEFIELIKREV
jgi:hypothetical protein